MITVLKTPALNRVLLDANNTVIEIQSSNGAGFYFRALIYVDDVLFDEQGWSRIDDYTASKDLVKLLNDYFETVLNVYSANGLTEQTHLIKKINITIQEKTLDSDDIISFLDLPVFYFMYNIKPVYFDDSTKIQILGVTPPVLMISPKSKIMLPFYVKAIDESVSVTLTDNFGNEVNSQVIEAFTGKKVYLYAFDFSPVTLVKDTLYFELTITCGLREVKKIYKLLRFPDFAVTEIYFKNNFGYYIPAYFDGEVEIQDSFSSETYQQKDGTNAIFEINEEATYSINTGSLLQNERAIVNQIANSHEVLLRINNKLRKILPATKKLLEYRSKKHLYAQELLFTFSKNEKISNYYESEGGDWDENDFLPADWLT